jgi:hypothetical protein
MVGIADSMYPVIPVTNEIVEFLMGSACAGIDLRALREIIEILRRFSRRASTCRAQYTGYLPTPVLRGAIPK